VASLLQPIHEFIASIEGGFKHSDLPMVLQKIYLEYWLRKWLITYGFMANPAFSSPMQAVRQATGGVHFRTPTKLSLQNLEEQFDGQVMTSVGEERLEWVSPSSHEGPYQHYLDRYWYMDFYDGPHPLTNDVSPVDAGCKRYGSYPDRSFFVLPPDPYPAPRLHGFNVYPRLKPTNLDERNPWVDGDHATYLTDLDYNGIIPGMNQNTVHVFIEWILIRLLRGSEEDQITPLYLSYRRHSEPYERYESANNYEDIFADAGIEGGHGLIEREGASNAYSLTRAKIYVDILKIIGALRIHQINYESNLLPSYMYQWHDDTKTVTFHNGRVSYNAGWPDWFLGTTSLPYWYDSYGHTIIAYRTPHPPCDALAAQFTGGYVPGVGWRPTGPPYSLATSYLPTGRKTNRVLSCEHFQEVGKPKYSSYKNTGEPVTGIVPLWCRYLDYCTVKQVHQHVWFGDWYGTYATPAVAAREWRFSTSWGAEITVPSGFTMPGGTIYEYGIPGYRPIRWYCDGRITVTRQKVSNSAFESHLLRETGEIEIACEFTDHYPPTTHGLYVTNIAHSYMNVEIFPRFDCIVDADGVFAKFMEENSLPLQFDWQANPFDPTPYKNYAEQV